MNISHLVEKIKKGDNKSFEKLSSLQSVKCGLLVSAF